ncbi:zinc ribbon domain-containing protein [Cohnella suwonensis]|uniref:Zinc ribbon domain-containing protein n=1 Tax=Cohnella suwonensis TaxID=696072 RepID=A0ABW0LW98_9BACL
MYCAECGEKLVDSAISCPSCGSEVRQKPPATEAMLAAVSAPVAATLESPASEPDPFAGLPQGKTLALSTRAKALILLLLAAGAVLYFMLKSAGGGDAQSTPEGVVKGFFIAVQAENAEKMFSYMWSPENSDEVKKDLIKQYNELFKSDALKIVDYEILSSQTTEKTATVKYKMIVKQEQNEQMVEESFQLSKFDDKWYLDGF